jgi:hypothetical protein
MYFASTNRFNFKNNVSCGRGEILAPQSTLKSGTVKIVDDWVISTEPGRRTNEPKNDNPGPLSYSPRQGIGLSNKSVVSFKSDSNSSKIDKSLYESPGPNSYDINYNDSMIKPTFNKTKGRAWIKNINKTDIRGSIEEINDKGQTVLINRFPSKESTKKEIIINEEKIKPKISTKKEYKDVYQLMKKIVLPSSNNIIEEVNDVNEENMKEIVKEDD